MFNPPSASHQGGVWERLIRSTKKILRSLVGQRELNDESPRTFLVEVEEIMNDRPITPVLSDGPTRSRSTHPQPHTSPTSESFNFSRGVQWTRQVQREMEARSNISRLVLGKVDHQIFAYFTENAEMVEEDA